jgi:hypothetical protein
VKAAARSKTRRTAMMNTDQLACFAANRRRPSELAKSRPVEFRDGGELHSLATIAEWLRYEGRDRERSVRRLFARHGVRMIRRGRGVYFVTEQQFAELIEKMTCLPSDGEAKSFTSAVRSVSGAKRVSSKSILAGQIAAKLQKRTAPSSNPISDTKSFTVVEGGRTF